jgi:hypothetical protein
MAVDALAAGGGCRVVGMRLGIEPGRQVALAADLVARRTQLQAVRVMAIRAQDSLLTHQALKEGAILIDFAEDLTVRMIEVGGEEGRLLAVEEGLSVGELRRDLESPRMTPGTGIDLQTEGRRA